MAKDDWTLTAEGITILRERISEKINEVTGNNNNDDDAVVERVIDLVQNGMPDDDEAMSRELNEILEDDSGSFQTWLRDHLECNVSLYAQKTEPHSSGAENLNLGTSGKRCKWMWKCLGMDKDETETEDKPPEQVEEVDRTERRRPGKERVMVCNKWPMLLSFVCCGWHRRDRPLIIRYYCSGHLRISIIDGNSEKDCYTKALEPLKYAYVVGSCNGLLLISRRGTASESCMNLLFNPLSKKCFTTDSGPSETAACGFFFHPLDKECRILSVRKLNDQNEYHVYLFGENRWRKTLKPHFSCQPYTSEERFTSETRIDCNPAIVRHALHWYIGQIMVFDMVTEEFSTKSNPISEEQYKGGCRVQRLLVKDDQLCLCYVGHDDSAMDIWICEDYDTWSWVKKYVVSLDWDMGKYPTQKEFTIKDIFRDVRVLSIRENEMILFWISRGMFSYNLGKSTVKKIHLRKCEMDLHDYDYDWSSGFQVYNPTNQ